MGFVVSIASAARSFLYLKSMKAWYKKKKKKKRHEFGFFTQPSKLLSLLLSSIYNLYIFTQTFKDQNVLSDNDPPSTILLRVLVSQQKREVFVIKLSGYLLQVLPVRVPYCNISSCFDSSIETGDRPASTGPKGGF